MGGSCFKQSLFTFILWILVILFLLARVSRRLSRGAPTPTTILSRQVLPFRYIIEPIALMRYHPIERFNLFSQMLHNITEAASGNPTPSLRPVENYVKLLLYNNLVIDASQAVASGIIIERVG